MPQHARRGSELEDGTRRPRSPPIAAVKAEHLASTGGVNPESPIPLPDYDEAGVEMLDVTTCGIGARSGVDAVRAR